MACSPVQSTTTTTTTTTTSQPLSLQQICLKHLSITDLIKLIQKPTLTDQEESLQKAAKTQLARILQTKYNMKLISSKSLHEFFSELSHILSIVSPNASASKYSEKLLTLIPALQNCITIEDVVKVITNTPPQELIQLLNIFLKMQPKQCFTTMFILGVISCSHPEEDTNPPNFDMEHSRELFSKAIRLCYKAFMPEVISTIAALGFDVPNLGGQDLLNLVWQNRSLSFIITLIEAGCLVPSFDVSKFDLLKLTEPGFESTTLAVFKLLLLTDSLKTIEAVFETFSHLLDKMPLSVRARLLTNVDLQISKERNKPHDQINEDKVQLLLFIQKKITSHCFYLV